MNCCESDKNHSVSFSECPNCGDVSYVTKDISPEYLFKLFKRIVRIEDFIKSRFVNPFREK